ncbi:XcbB/CpsF family capsular polysaccharide biosynthesis protein [Caballeronia sp. EK]|uniref:XcbB/CpsF family capsular polysaccharide biosynthesis protein n=1 Tax=Caballeronia sp. EK TaxID=2767469 RepID=UPI00165620D4|nr:XcbB/CpsF family capsular polysaccharide biosynthesis protein [Caballeronia sp. EK]
MTCTATQTGPEPVTLMHRRLASDAHNSRPRMFDNKIATVDSQRLLDADLAGDTGCLRILNVDMTSYGDPEKNIIALAYRNPPLRKKLVELTNKGFYVYKHVGSVSSLLHHSEIPKVWQKITEGTLKTFRSLTYGLAAPEITSGPARLVVVFSSMNEDLFNASFSTRYFCGNFPSIQKYLPANTYVLRIADIGSVVGSFYLNTHYSSETERDVQDLIRDICQTHGMSVDRDVVLYGASKGGTAALYHGLIGGMKAVSIDPIVSDDYYLTRWKDTHFTEGTFPVTKQEKFTSTLASTKFVNHINVICSERSPQFRYINEILRASSLANEINFFNSLHPEITDHPHVAPNTINIAVALMNGLFYGFVTPRGIGGAVI